MDRALALIPDEPNLLRLKFSALQATGDVDGARVVGRRLMAATPSDARNAREMLALGVGEEESAKIANQLHILCRQQPGDAQSWRAVARVYHNVGDYERGIEIMEEGIAACDSGALRLVRALTLPKVPRSLEQIVRVRESMATHLDAIIGGGYRVSDIAGEVGLTAFHLAYHGMNDRSLQEKIAAAHLAVAPDLKWTSPDSAKPRPPGRKMRIGFISRYFTMHAVGMLVGGFIRSFPRTHFDTILIHVPGAQDDFTEGLNREVSAAIMLSGELASSREAIAGLELDVLFYTDIGMDPFTYYLAFSRLARVQVVWPGHPVTTGISTIDAYISSAVHEPVGAQAHYSEKLIALKSLLFFGRPRHFKPEIRDLGLPRDGRLYAVPSSIYKFHPDLDRLLARIVAADDRAYIVVVGDGTAWYRTLYQRMSQAIPDLSRRLVVLPYLSKQSFFSLLKSVDAVLDTVHFGGGNTSMDCFAAGVPLVNLEGQFLRGRLTTGMYRHMGLGDFPSVTEDDYVARALRTAGDPAFRAEGEAEIVARAGKLFDDRMILDELEHHLTQLVAAAQA